MNTRRIYRSRYDKQLAGVAGGMAEYLDLDPTLVRVLWILSVFLGGFTILLYIILAFVMPLAPVGPVAAGPGSTWAPGGTWTPAGAPVPGNTAAAGTPGAPDSEAVNEGAAAANATDESPTQGWVAGQGGWADPAGTGSQGWAAQDPGWAPAAGQPRGAGAAVYAGVLLVVFGAIALADTVIPGLAAVSLWPLLLVALGAMLLVGSMRRRTDDETP